MDCALSCLTQPQVKKVQSSFSAMDFLRAKTAGPMSTWKESSVKKASPHFDLIFLGMERARDNLKISRSRKLLMMYLAPFYI